MVVVDACDVPNLQIYGKRPTFRRLGVLVHGPHSFKPWTVWPLNYASQIGSTFGRGNRSAI